ncbi:NAD(P)H-dependent oxidoreductase [Planktotalea sp.]|uniref:NAD(P)H-dependent oxidoreductase n=1 Tax=Planktotalea sp. TaxID=2029877 RepID=UPI0032973690
MTRLLRIDSSSHTSGSHSNQLADQAEAMWRETNPQGRVATWHLGRAPIPVLSQETMNGFFSRQDKLSDDLQQATALSDQLNSELQAADLSTAMAGARLETV